MTLFGLVKRSSLVLIACSAMLLGGNALNAQISRGEFTLPVQTHWAGAVMAPGTYSYTLDQATMGLMFSVRGQGTSVRIPATGAVSTGNTFEGSKLLLTTTDRGETRVSSIQIGHLGITVRYLPVKVDEAFSPSDKHKDSHKAS